MPALHAETFVAVCGFACRYSHLSDAFFGRREPEVNLVFLSLAFLFAGSLVSLILGKSPWARTFGATSNILGCIAGIVPACSVLLHGNLEMHSSAWEIPMGAFAVILDPLSAFFALTILAVCGLASLYAVHYLKHSEGKKNIGVFWFFFNLLTASMLLVVLANNGILFIAAWELMSLASFFLVVHEKQQDNVRRAGWTYLVATHLGTAFLLVMFLLLDRQTGTMGFLLFPGSDATGAMRSLLFGLALIGFGTKAGFMPLHVWLPDAHPAAPSPVSAVMSGVMIKTGIYGLVRTLTFLGVPPAWWGWVLIAVGVVSGVMGVLFAIAQHDLKRLLAYHSVENIGIIALGLGVGMLGLSYGQHFLATAGFLGALLHVMNHAIFKSLLFMSVGSVIQATGTREMDHLGGIMKKMPVTAMGFLVGSLAICGLPPLNGFISEFIIYYASWKTVIGAHGVPISGQALCLLVIGSLALIGGLALACFTKAFGVVFLGESRSKHTQQATETGWQMWTPMVVLALACFAIGIMSPYVVNLTLSPVSTVLARCTHTRTPLQGEWFGLHGVMQAIVGTSLCFFALLALLLLFRFRLMSGRKSAKTVTWDCGYAAPTPRMQYTSSSFVQPLIHLFLPFLRTKHELKKPEGYFPESAEFSSQTPDVYREHVYRPIFAAVESALSKFHWIQHGRLNLYILSIVMALLVLLIWKL